MNLWQHLVPSVYGVGNMVAAVFRQKQISDSEIIFHPKIDGQNLNLNLSR